jgi:proteasome lid subunit RPN8/RPN11
VAEAASTTFWSSPRCPFAVRTSTGLLEQLNLAVTESFLTFRRGGLEIGGLLFGKRTGNHVDLLAHRPIFCEHAQGPGFVLSPADHSRLSRQMGDWRLDPLLHGMVVVGWYRSRTRGPLLPAAEDVTFHSQYFPDAFQFLLVLKPDLGSPTRVTVFFPSVEGVLDPDSGFAEIELAKAVIAQEQWRPPVAASPPPPPRPDGEPGTTRTLVQRSHHFLAVGLFLAAVAAMLVGALWAPKDQSLGLRVSGSGGRVRIDWNRAAPILEEVRGGIVEIREEDALATTSLEPFELRQSSVYYFSRTGQVEVRLRVETVAGRRIEERANIQLPAH